MRRIHHISQSFELSILLGVLVIALAGCGLEQSQRFGNDPDPTDPGGGNDDGWTVPEDIGTPDADPDTGPEDDIGDGDADVSTPDADAGTCPDASDPDVRYISKSPEVCTSVRIACENGNVPFSNECGCGCHDIEPTCDAQDATPIGDCRMLLGVKFDGSRCVTIGGCRCEGSECNQLFSTTDACEAAYDSCITPDCSPQAIRGEGACAKFLGYKFDGSSCVGISGCRCSGEDCDSMYSQRSACRQAHSECLNNSQECGGWAPPCDRDEYCDFPNNSCGFADQTGTCNSAPRGCPEYYDPVCGCDDNTYGNECKAHAAGVDIKSMSACPE